MKWIMSIVFITLLTSCETGQTSPEYFSIPDKDIPGLEERALHGDGYAGFVLGDFFLFTPRDRASALYWFKVSARDGDVRGMDNAASLLLEKKDDPESQTQARYWLEKAKEKGDALAASRLATLDSNRE